MIALDWSGQLLFIESAIQKRPSLSTHVLKIPKHRWSLKAAFPYTKDKNSPTPEPIRVFIEAALVFAFQQNT